MTTSATLGMEKDVETQKVHLPIVERRIGKDRRRAETQAAKEALPGEVDETLKRAAEIEQASLAAINAFGDAITALDNDYRRESATILSKLITAVAPKFAETAALTELEALLAERRSESAGAISLKVGRLVNALIQEKVDPTILDAHRITLIADDKLSDYAIHAKWREGSFVHEPDALITKFLEILSKETPFSTGEGK
ncbi:MAG: hypothetical protein AAGD92_06995 [Pseudomonadota bacterium]